MTDERINEAIAEACGLKKPSRKVKLNDKGFFVTQHAKLPDYCSDLNAMHEVENCLSLDDRNHYIDALGTIYKDSWEFATATARQRAEAFLRALGLWKTDHSGEPTEMEVQK